MLPAVLTNALHKWHKPSKYSVRVILTTCLASLGGGLFGFDTGSIGAITEMHSFEEQFGVLTPTMRGVVVAIILLPSAFTGMLAGNIADKISRKYSISVGAAIFAVGSALSAASTGDSLAMLLVGRCIAGLGEGLFLGCTGVYLTEISPRHLRSQAVLIMQLYTTGAVALGFFVCYGTVNIPNSMGWRVPFIIQTFTATMLAIGMPFVTYSPRWLISKGRIDEAKQVIDSLVAPDHDNEKRELLAVPPAQLAARNKSQLEAMKDIWQPGVRGRTVLGVALNVFQQLSGIDFVLFFAPLLFNQAGLDPSTSSFIASGCTGLVLVACTYAGTFYIDRIGRRKIWIVGGTCTATCHMVLGIFYATGVPRLSEAGKYATIVFIELFAVSFTSSWSIVTRLYAAEVQPTRTRAAATSFGQGANQLANFAVAVSGPAFLDRSSYSPYFFYGACTAIGVVFGYLYMHEVRGQTLESIDATFEGSAVAVSLPKVFRAARLTQVRQRKNSRSQSATLPGETRADLREHFKMDAIRETRDESAVDD
ncbi:uncharacterized protein JCM10292_003172 [Rhodotorula paludigena]|uniref:uncharacterized protein n=1 Tax=Rhodotorula paludigena TaxID=86838 RepID=UPI0031761EDA